MKKMMNKKQKSRGYHERKKAKERELYNEFEEFNYEENLAKRLKKGKITKEEFDRLVNQIDHKYERN